MAGSVHHFLIKPTSALADAAAGLMDFWLNRQNKGNAINPETFLPGQRQFYLLRRSNRNRPNSFRFGNSEGNLLGRGCSDFETRIFYPALKCYSSRAILRTKKVQLVKVTRSRPDAITTSGSLCKIFCIDYKRKAVTWKCISSANSFDEFEIIFDWLDITLRLRPSGNLNERRKDSLRSYEKKIVLLSKNTVELPQKLYTFRRLCTSYEKVIGLPETFYSC